MNFSNNFLLLSIIFVPVIGSFILPALGWASERLRNLFALLFVLLSLVFSFALIPTVFGGNTITITKLLPLGMNFVLVADKLAVFMAIVSSLIGAVIVFYSFEYISHYENRNEYYFLVVLFLGSMMGIVFSGNLIFLYTFWEITAIASYRLIGFYREPDVVLKADKSFLVTVFGALVMLIGFIGIGQITGSFDLSVIRDIFKSTPLPNLLVLLILFGIFSKSATLPFHTWLPDAGVAPSPVTALLHAAVLVKIGVYVYARLFLATFTVPEIWHTIVPLVAGLSALVSAGAAMVDTDIKRIIAYSTISQIGFIFLGLSVDNEMAVAGGLLYILMHGLAKGGLFLSAGIIEQSTKVKDITKLGGLVSKLPVTAAAFILCTFSIMGIPPFGGFFCKYMVIAGAISSGHFYIALAFMVGAFMTLIYLLRLFTLVFLGEVKTEPVHGETSIMVSSVVILAFLSLVSGISIYYIAGPVQSIASELMGIIR
ncbi:MAG: NADH-quinone oxidoreductase subunit L [Elusimicrobia bacterium]|nr:NADH-quinone oxidoreductase subunit L [Candidatus Liberimonas magnetica]